MSEMTIEEKLQFLNANAIERLHVPYDGFNEALHGVAWTGRATVFPCPMGMASTWNQDLVRKMGVAVSFEALAKHSNGTNALSFYAPNINIVRDIRWGRAQETYGEDPTLTGTLASKYIEGMQFPKGKNERGDLAIRNVAKHFAAYNLESNFAMGGVDGQFRLSYDANVSRVDMKNTFLPAFEEIVNDVSGIMCAYNSVNGTPICANSHMIHEILRESMNFDGIVVTDCGAIDFMISNHKWNHSDGRPYNRTEAAAATLSAGVDLNCGSAFSTLPEALNQSLINITNVDNSVRRQLLGYMRLGLFQDTRTNQKDWRRNISMNVVDSVSHRDLAREIASESVIVLKNSDGVLPLARFGMTDFTQRDDAPLKIAVIGPNANRTMTLTSNYAGCKDKAGGPILSNCHFVNPLQGIRDVAKELDHLGNVTYAMGVDIDSDREDGIAEAISVAEDADVAIVVVGLITCQEVGDQCIEAEARDRSMFDSFCLSVSTSQISLSLPTQHTHTHTHTVCEPTGTGSSPPKDFGTGLPGKQNLLIESLVKYTDTPIMLVVESGSAVSIPFAAKSNGVAAIVQYFYSGVLGGK